MKWAAGGPERLTFLHLLSDAKVRVEPEDFRRCAPGFDGVAPSSVEVVRERPFLTHLLTRTFSNISSKKKKRVTLSAQEREGHELTHLPSQPWCSV